jgi:hypothetical protein
MTEDEEWAVRSWLACYEDIHKNMLERGIIFLTQNDIVTVIQELRRTLDDSSE